MLLTPKRESLALFVGDLIAFTVALWGALALRSFSFPINEYFLLHLYPFSFLFIVWAFIFFIAGLYNRSAQFLHRGLPERILVVQSLNVAGAALFFFLSPQFGIAPKTVLALYLIISSTCIFIWRVGIFPLFRLRRKAGALMIGTGPEVQALLDEVNAHDRYPFTFVSTIDTRTAEMHHIVQQLSQRMQDGSTSIIVADPRAPVLTQALPIIYDAAFRRRGFVFMSIDRLYEDVFERTPLSAVEYNWVLAHLSSALTYDFFKRVFDIVLVLMLTVPAVFVAGMLALAIKLEDGGRIFVWQERVGLLYRPVRLCYLRRYVEDRDVPSKNGNTLNSHGNHKRVRTLTRVGAFMKKHHLDELPLLWNVLRGNLSFVGPKPEVPARALEYSSKIPYYNARYLVTPGWTGWARVMREDVMGRDADVEEMKHLLTYDLYYLKNRSFMLDTYTLLQSIRVFCVGRIKSVTGHGRPRSY